MPAPALFDALWRTAEALETEDTFTRLHLAFLVEAVHVQGLQPDARWCVRPAWADSTWPPPSGNPVHRSGTISFLHRTRPRFFAFKARKLMR